jgi:hypothetical protein
MFLGFYGFFGATWLDANITFVQSFIKIILSLASSNSVISVLCITSINNYKQNSLSFIHIINNKSHSSATNEIEDPYL